MGLRSLVPAERSRAKSPWAIMAICMNWSTLSPSSPSTSRVTVCTLVTGTQSSRMPPSSPTHREAVALVHVASPLPFSLGRRYSRPLRTRQCRDPAMKSSSTKPSVPNAAKSEYSDVALSDPAAVLPNSANVTASKTVVLPAPVSPQMR